MATSCKSDIHDGAIQSKISGRHTSREATYVASFARNSCRRGISKPSPMPAGAGPWRQGQGARKCRRQGQGANKCRASGADLLAAVAHGTVPARAAATGTGSSSKKTARPSGYGVAELSDDEAQVSRHDDAAQPAAEEPARHLVSSARRRSPQDISCRAPDAGAGGRSSCRAR
jgi:hypothetical protein